MSCSAPAARVSPGAGRLGSCSGATSSSSSSPATGYLLGVTQGKEYAEPEWYADLWLTIVWVTYLLVFLGTLWRRKEPHIYVANWFYLAFIVTIAMLHIVNNAGTAGALHELDERHSLVGRPGCDDAVVVRP